MIRVGAVDQEVIRGGGRVDLSDGRGEGNTAGKPAVGLQGEGDRDRQPGAAGRLDDADRLAGVGQVSAVIMSAPASAKAWICGRW